jgi:hypothetical protein
MIDLSHVVVYDLECLPNVWTCCMSPLYGDHYDVYEISEFRDDRTAMMQRLNWIQQNNIAMIGFNNEGYDYALLHLLFNNPSATYQMLHAKSQEIITSGYGDNRWAHTVWPRDRFAPQIDLMAMNRFNTQAKATSLKALQFAMRSPTIVESSLPFDRAVTEDEINLELIPYNKHDVKETKQFALHMIEAIKFRLSMVDQYGIECISWDDVKIGAQMLIRQLGDNLCFDRSSGRKVPRQTVRTSIPVSDIIFPYIYFRDPELQRVLNFMRGVTLTHSDMSKDAGKDEQSPLTIEATVGGVVMRFGSGGVHGSVRSQRFKSGDGWTIEDDDVAGMYPAVSNVNKLAPEHLGEPFVAVYASLPEERAKYPKGTVDNKRFKLAGNAAWGQSKMPYGPFYDPKYALTIPINGQLLICMLIDWMLELPSFKLIQANTDGISYILHESDYARAQEIKQAWQEYTMLELENARYERLWIKDVSNYVAEDTKGKLKLKGAAYWHPDPTDYFASVTANEAWHKNLSALIIPRAAVLAMVHGIDPAHIIRAHTDPFDFMLRCKVGRSDQLLLGDKQVQRVFRYYVATNGAPLVKVSPPVAGGVIGEWKRANGVTKAYYEQIMAETGGQWDERVCTKNRSRYDERRTTVESGWLVADCCDASRFDWSNVNYDYYIAEARKLVIS